jgi:hypothetical protein
MFSYNDLRKKLLVVVCESSGPVSIRPTVAAPAKRTEPVLWSRNRK